MKKLFFALVGGALYFVLVMHLVSTGSHGMCFVFMGGWLCWIVYYRIRRG